MKTLSALVERDSFDVPAFALDHFLKKVRENSTLDSQLSTRGSGAFGCGGATL